MWVATTSQICSFSPLLVVTSCLFLFNVGHCVTSLTGHFSHCSSLFSFQFLSFLFCYLQHYLCRYHNNQLYRCAYVPLSVPVILFMIRGYIYVYFCMNIKIMEPYLSFLSLSLTLPLSVFCFALFFVRCLVSSFLSHSRFLVSACFLFCFVVVLVFVSLLRRIMRVCGFFLCFGLLTCKVLMKALSSRRFT